MPYKITQWDRQWVDEMRQNPMGPHSPNLQRVLNTLRAGPAKGRHVLVTRKPFAEWVLAVHQGYGKPFRILEDQVFTDRAAAEWHVFKLRWKAHTGEDLN
ncbi:MAG: hypothetical protein R3F55_02685 [Alphaproteobacteria bacterium]